ncbi:hypothetical protein FEE95_20760 [Maribacter algarum]|uniref:SnoaL-like domain-containing protein n=1 Tax=Maribacter algarum (ex Zhang et al. 2020) TaxID=2578118 RepID=A0A5S3Q5S6_9FLAO|nr:hypothetical protein [Maribacter algarum]TMM52121.1 hypothetical protein FEE95_20760 [Maribacter algarum]
MKKYISGFCVFLLFSCMEEQVMTSEAEKELIKEIVTQETLAYMEKNYQKWSSFWNHSDEVLRLDISDSGFSQTRGWEKNGAHIETFFVENPEPITSTFENSNYLIFCDSELAWAAFDQKWTTNSGDESLAKATVTLVKKSNDWEIISYTAIQYEPDAGEANTLTRE